MSRPAIDPAIAIQINGFDCYDERIVEHFSRLQVSQVERFIRCAWTNRLSLAGYLLGAAGTKPKSYPDVTWMYCQDIQIDGEGGMSVGPNGSLAYDRALLRCLYKPLEFQGTNAVEAGNDTIDIGVEMIPLPLDKPVLRYGTSGTNYVTAYTNPPIKVTTESITRTRYNLASVPVATYEGLIDHTNSNTYLGRAAETLRFDGASTTRVFDTSGNAVYHACLHFSWRSIGWNKILNPTTGTFDTVTFINGGTKPYPPADLSPLGIT